MPSKRASLILFVLFAAVVLNVLTVYIPIAMNSRQAFLLSFTYCPSPQLNSSNSVSDEKVNDTPSNAAAKSESNMCIPEKRCPRQTDYHPTCKNTALMAPSPNETYTQPPPLRSVHDPDSYLDDLLTFFHGKRIALVGDSLTRQWFETLSCRLGLHQQFYEIKKNGVNGPVPKRVLEARQYNITSTEQARKPRGREYIYGYIRAVPTFTLPLGPLDPLPSVDIKRAPVKDGCQKLRTTIEYYKMDMLERSANLLDFVVKYGKPDILVFNLGVHNKVANSYLHDLRFLMKECSKINSMGTSNNSTKTLCLFRETFPRHWVAYDYVDNDSSPSKHNPKIPTYNWRFNKDLMRRQACGPFLPGIYPIEFNHNSFVPDVAMENGNVGVVHVEDFARDAWKWHVKDDCTHFCHDNEFWDLAHEALVDTALEKLAE